MDSRRSAIVRIARRITWIAWTLLACAAITFVWAIAFTKGVQALINTLLIALLGFLVPSLFVFWVSWVLSGMQSAEQDEDGALAGASESQDGERSRWLRYTFAIAATLVAAGARALLMPVVGYAQPYPMFYLAVAASAWYGGMGPALLANALSMLAVWYWFIPPTWSLDFSRVGDVVGLGLFFAVSITIAGMTSSLRAVRRRGDARVPGVGERGAAPGSRDPGLRAIADDVPAMIWLTDAEGERVYFNRAATEFTGRPLDRLLGRGWIGSIHPDDADTVVDAFRRSVDAREPYCATFRLRCRDGEYRLVRDTARPRFDAGGGYVGHIGACVEVAQQVPAHADEYAR